MTRPLPAPGSRRAGLPAREARPADLVPLDAAAALRMARRAVDLAADKKAIDIVLLGIGELTTVADYLVICAGSSERQLGAIADGITEGLAADGIDPLGREGAAGAHWVLLDFGAVDRARLRAPRAGLLPARAPLGGRPDAAADPVAAVLPPGYLRVMRGPRSPT